MSKEKILVVDDEPKLVRLVREVLLATGYDVVAASSGDQAVEMAALEQPDLLILDIILLGEMDGYEVARRIREFSDIPIIMLTAKVREADMLRGFQVGVDDYIKKPFSSKELLARVRAVLGRVRAQADEQPGTEIVCGDLRIDLPRRRVALGEQQINLTPTEYKLLIELAIHPNQVLLHKQILSSVWGKEYCDNMDCLRTYIYQLRQKLEADPANPKLILRHPGVGYVLVCAEQEPG